MTQTDYSMWLTKPQAAQAIGVSTKQIERLAQDKRLQFVRWRRPEGGPMIVVYHPGDVERLAKDRSPDTAPFVLPAESVTLIKPVNGEVRQGFTDQLAEAITAASQTVADMALRVPLAQRLFLTIQEASEYTGLSISFLRVLTAKNGSLRIEKGVGRHGADMVRRSELDKLG